MVAVAQEASPGWELILVVLVVVAMLVVMVVVGVRDWIRETAADRSRRESRDRAS